jgi:hypothetical protein
VKVVVPLAGSCVASQGIEQHQRWCSFAEVFTCQVCSFVEMFFAGKLWCHGM